MWASGFRPYSSALMRGESRFLERCLGLAWTKLERQDGCHTSLLTVLLSGLLLKRSSDCPEPHSCSDGNKRVLPPALGRPTADHFDHLAFHEIPYWDGSYVTALP